MRWNWMDPEEHAEGPAGRGLTAARGYRRRAAQGIRIARGSRNSCRALRPGLRCDAVS